MHILLRLKNDSFFQTPLFKHREKIFFATTGIANTLIYSAMLILFVQWFGLNQIIASVISFMIANAFSFFVNSFFTFKARPTWKIYWKFLITYIGSFLLTIGSSALAQTMHWHYLIGLLFVIILGPILTFVSLKYFAFKPINKK